MPPTRHRSRPGDRRPRAACGLPCPPALALIATLLSAPAASALPPAAPARAVAEWEPAHGTLIRWPLGISYALVRELAEDDSVYVLCETPSAENAARTSFQNNGVDLAHCRFLRVGTYSHWTRDWGPHSVFDAGGRLGIADPVFNGYPWVPPTLTGDLPPDDALRPLVPARDPAADPAKGSRGYEEDDAVNAQLAAWLGLPVWSMPAYCTGGNFMTDGHGLGFSTTQMLNENQPLMGEAQFRAYAEQYLGVTGYTFLHGTEDLGIQHVDCWAKLLDEETFLVKRVPSWHEEYPRIELNLQILEGLTNCYGRPYRIVRIDTPPYNGYDVAAYTNSLILNRKVLVPTFGISGDAAALQTYREAMPGYEVLGFSGSTAYPWYYYDALHCRTMAIFDDRMLRVWHRRLDAELPPLAEYRLTALIDDRSEAGLVESSLLAFWRQQGETTWQSVPLTPLAAPDSFEARIPAVIPGTTIEYYLSAEDRSGRRETLPRVAPEGFYSFRVQADPAAVDPSGSRPDRRMEQDLRLSLEPNPARGPTTVILVPRATAPLEVRVCGATGRVVRHLWSGAGRADRELRLAWDGTTDSGARCPAGVYWINARHAAGVTAARLVVLR